MHYAGPELRALVERLVQSLAGQGALAVALVGSHSRGDATPESDLDLAVIGDGPHYRLEVHDGRLVSVGWATAEEQRSRLYDPTYLGTNVPGWRDAVLLHDPDGVAAAIKREAVGWQWEQVEDRCREWVSEALTGDAEEASKLAASLRRGEATVAAVQRSVLVLHLARILALHRRILYGSEMRLWDLVAGEMGRPWADAQAAALGLGGESLEASCTAALRLFALALDEVRPLLSQRQLAVIEQALGEAQL